MSEIKYAPVQAQLIIWEQQIKLKQHLTGKSKVKIVLSEPLNLIQRKRQKFELTSVQSEALSLLMQKGTYGCYKVQRESVQEFSNSDPYGYDGPSEDESWSWFTLEVE